MKQVKKQGFVVGCLGFMAYQPLFVSLTPNLFLCNCSISNNSV